MSISNILVPNNYNIYSGNTITGNINCDNINATGSITSNTPKTDYSIFCDPYEYFLILNGFDQDINPFFLNNFMYAPTSLNTFNQTFSNVTMEYRTTANKGYELTSVDVIYNISGENLSSAQLLIHVITFTNGITPTIISLPLSGSGALPTIMQANSTDVYVYNVQILDPSFLSQGQFIDLILQFSDNTSSSTTFVGVLLNFSRNDL